jgi:Concanavalin A-like lectin/glucanases superfamily
MRIIRAFVSAHAILFILISISISQTSCTKTVTEHDTLTNLQYELVAYYNFNNGNLNDSSGNGNNITFNNAVLTSDRFGRAGNAYKFSGGAYMQVPNSVTLNPSQITLMAIVRLDGYYTGTAWGNEILMKGPADQANGVYGLRVHPLSYDLTQALDTTTEMFTGFYGDGANAGIADTTFKIKGGDWNTVIYTYDGFVTKLYVNGVLKITRMAPFGYNTNTSDLYIGKTENITYPYNFDGAIDEIRIYSKALSPYLISKLNALTE